MDSLSFEDAYAELETTVRRLEEGNLPLEEALALYERGIILAQLCARHLDAAELRVEELSQAVSEPASDYDLDNDPDLAEEAPY